MRFAFRSGGLAMLVFASAADAQSPKPTLTPETMPRLFEFDGDRMQIIPPPGAPSDRAYTYRFDEKKLELLPVPKDGELLSLEDGKVLPREAPPGELCLATVERCQAEAKLHRHPYAPGWATLYYAMN